MQPKLLHGECCAIGHVKGAEVARAMGICSAATVGRLSRVLKAYGLPVEMPNHVQHPRCTAERVLRRMVLDKKNTKGTIRCVLLDAIGSVKRVSDTGAYAHTIDPSLLLRVLSPGCTVGCDLARLPSALSCIPGFTVPGSKSLSNRLLLLAGLSRGACRLRGLLASDDTEVMMTALEKLGLARFAWEDNGATLVVEGTGVSSRATLPRRRGWRSLHGNAGTATRSSSVLTLVVRSDPPGSDSRGISITGALGRSRDRRALVEALRAHGCRIDYAGTRVIFHLVLVADYPAAPSTLAVSSSLSAWCFFSAVCQQAHSRRPREQGRHEPTYIDMTVSCMRMFGVDVVVSQRGRKREV